MRRCNVELRRPYDVGGKVFVCRPLGLIWVKHLKRFQLHLLMRKIKGCGADPNAIKVS